MHLSRVSRYVKLKSPNSKNSFPKVKRHVKKNSNRFKKETLQTQHWKRSFHISIRNAKKNKKPLKERMRKSKLTLHHTPNSLENMTKVVLTAKISK